MVDAERRDAADKRPLDHVRCVEPAAQPDLDDRSVGWRSRKGEEGDGRRHLEEAGVDAVARIEDLAEKVRQRFVFDQLSGDPDPLVEADEMRAGEGVDRSAARLQRGAEKGAGRALPVRAGDVESRRKAILRTAEPIEQAGDAIEAEPVAAGREQRQPVELRLDGRIVRPREVRHQAAFFSGDR